MSKAKMRLLLTIPTIHTFIQEGDFAIYQTLVQILIPEVLRPIPPSLTQAIRNFAKSLESWLMTAMTDCPAVSLYQLLFTIPIAHRISGNHRHQTLNGSIVLPNSAKIHFSKSLGTGCQGCSTKPATDYANALRFEQSRLRQCPRASQLGVRL